MSSMLSKSKSIDDSISNKNINNNNKNKNTSSSSRSTILKNNIINEDDDNSSIDIDVELAQLDLETLNDFVNGTLGSFEIPSNQKSSSSSSSIQTIQNNNSNKINNNLFINSSNNNILTKLTTPPTTKKISGGSSSSSSDNKKLSISKDSNSNVSTTTTTHTKLQSKEKGNSSGISSVVNNNTTTQKVLVLNINETKVYGSSSSSDKKIKKLLSMEKVKLQANGSNSMGKPGPSIKPTKNHPSDISVHGTTGNIDAGILRMELTVAVEQNKVDKVRRILNSGIDANSVCDEKGRWPLHIAAFLGHATLVKLLLEHGAQKDQPDTALERTPLLYAAATSPEILQILLNYRVDIHSKNKFGATGLHYAAGAGQAECCRLLATAGCDVNSRDRQKMTPLHMAARVDDIRSIETLLEYGADIHAKDSSGKSALHHAAETCEGMASDYRKMGTTFRRLISSGITVNAIDHDGKTALYYAIQTGSVEAVMILHEMGADMTDAVSLLTMARKFPVAIRAFLDKCVSSNIDTCDAESKQFYIQFDYTCLTLFPKDIPKDKLLSMQNREETESILQEMGALHGLTKCTDTSILSHPVCESLLRLKWKKVKWYLYLDMLLFAVFLAFLTAVIFMEYESDSTGGESDNSTMDTSGQEGQPAALISEQKAVHCMDTSRNMVVWSILWVLTAALGVREMVQLIQAPLHYVVQIENMLELVLVSSVALLSLAECGVESFVNGRDHFAAVCLIVGWTIQVTLYGKIPVFGVYIRMFAAVAVNILKCIFTYLGLLFAFSLTLHFLFRSQKDFDSVGFTFLKTFAMMIGEIELARTFIDKPTSHGGEAHIVPFTSHFIFLLFMIFVSVVLMSLLVALAVCDISSMQREGAYMQLVQVASQLEDALQRRSLLYPQFGMHDLRSIHQRKGVIFPNLKDHGKLSKDALEIVMTQHTKKLDGHNGLSQPPYSTESSNMMKANGEVVEDLIQKLRNKMDKYAADVERRNEQIFQEIRVTQDKGSIQLTTDILLIKNQLEDMNLYLRGLNNTLKHLAERPMQLKLDSPNYTKTNQVQQNPEELLVENVSLVSSVPEPQTTNFNLPSSTPSYRHTHTKDQNNSRSDSPTEVLVSTDNYLEVPSVEET